MKNLESPRLSGRFDSGVGGEREGERLWDFIEGIISGKGMLVYKRQQYTFKNRKGKT